MTRLSALSLSFCLALALLVSTALSAAAAAAPGDDEAQIRAQVERYRQSLIHIDDPSLRQNLWAMTPDVTFIHPRGHERGWKAIDENAYQKIMGGTFSRRNLTLTDGPHIALYGDAAVVEFDWNFDATVREDGSPMHTQGRESQVYIKFPDQGWRLVQVHYSGPAVTGKREGF